MLFASIGLALAVLALVLLAIGPLGWRLGWWHFRFAFFWLMTSSAYLAIAALIVSILTLVFGWSHLGARGITFAALGVVLGAALVYVPWQYNQKRTALPPIHDITTDTENPPTFVAAVPVRAAQSANPLAYEAAVAKQQRDAYPDIVSFKVGLPPADAFKRALDAAKSMAGWTLVDTDPSSGRIEANETSQWFRFTDDVVIRVAADGAASRIDVRSVSRMGRSDFGVNAKRVRAYLTALKARAS